MIIWKGKGIAVVLFFMAVLAILAILKVKVEFCAATAFFATAIFSLYFGKKWNTGEAREFIDKKTGRMVILKPDHSLFFIKVEYWFFITFVLGILTLFSVSKIGSAFSAALFIIALIVIFSKKNKTRSMNYSQSIQEKKIERVTKKIKTNETIVVEEPKETDEEREKRRREKEDPSRFMPQ